jgi:hypothetical protein
MEIPWPRPRFSTRLAAIAYGILYVICKQGNKLNIQYEQHASELEVDKNIVLSRKIIMLLTARGAPKIVKTTKEAMTMPVGGTPLGG